MMMYGTDLYRRLTAETGVDVSWHEVGSLRLASTPARFEELQRQAGWARTFGLPLELLTTEEAHRALPADGPRRRPGRRLPADRWLAGPVEPGPGHGRGAKGSRRPDPTEHRVTGIDVQRGPRRGVTTDRATFSTEIVVNAGGIFAPEIGRLAGVTCRSSRWPTSTC
jgi:4-methylaminobutanoate oxidase (formaldehyde-forming)